MLNERWIIDEMISLKVSCVWVEIAVELSARKGEPGGSDGVIIRVEMFGVSGSSISLIKQSTTSTILTL